MKKLSLFSNIIIVTLVVFIVNPVYADLFVSGDTSIIFPLTGTYSGSSIDTGNQQFFSNVLQDGSTVSVLEGIWGLGYNEINNYYNSLSGVSSSTFTGDVTSARLIGVDLFVSMIPDDEFTASEIAVMADFLISGGSIFFLGDNSGLSHANAPINSALTGLGSSMSIVNDTIGSGFIQITGSYIASDPYTAGVSTFTYAATSEVTGGTTLFYATDGDHLDLTPFVAYETTVVPLPGAVVLGVLGLSVVGVKLCKKNA